MRDSLTKTKAEILLIFVILARSTSFVMTKIGLRDLDTFTLLGFRFILATLFILPFIGYRFKKTTRPAVYKGILLGAVYSAIMAAEVYALGISGAGTVALLENTAILMVPLFEAVLLRRLPKAPLVISTILAFSGVAMMSIEDGMITFGLGEALGLTAAVLFSVAIILTDRFSKTDDPILIGTVQVLTMGILSMLAAFIIERPTMPSSALTWQILLMLAVVCTGFGFTLQPFAQSRTSSERTGLFFALNPIFAVILSWLVLGENFRLSGIIGIVLILTGLILPELNKRLTRKNKLTSEKAKTLSKMASVE